VCVSFHSQYNLDQWYQSNLLLVISWCMSPMRSGYRELGLELVSLGDDHSHRPSNLPWWKKREMMEQEILSNVSRGIPHVKME
jgi:hypothetical protein